MIADDFETGTSRTEHMLTVGGDQYLLRYIGRAPDAQSGSFMRVQGLRVGHQLIVPAEMPRNGEDHE